MTPIQIASNVIDKLQEENRQSLETLHRTQSQVRTLELQLLEKEKLIKVLESRLRAGSNSFLEITIKQKDIVIRHLELQTKKLLEENKDLELEIINLKSLICPRCETKCCLSNLQDKASKSPAKKKSSARSIPCKTSTEVEQESRENMLKRIVEHKDKRIQHLSKEVQKLSQLEKDMTQKINRLQKLIPLSHMSSETLTEHLLAQIQILESQINLYQEQYDKMGITQNLLKKSKNIEGLKYDKNKSSDDLFMQGKEFPQSKTKKSPLPKRANLGFRDHSNVNISWDCFPAEDNSLIYNLHKLYNDVAELKQEFAAENDKFYQSLTREALRNEALKIEWQEMTNRLGDIAARLKDIITIYPSKSRESISDNDRENIILRLQDRLKETLEFMGTLQEENEELREKVNAVNQELREVQEEIIEKRGSKSLQEKMSVATQSSIQEIDNDRCLNENRIKSILKKTSVDTRSDSDVEKYEYETRKQNYDTQCSDLQDNGYPISFPNLKQQLKVTESCLKACQSLVAVLEKASKEKADRASDTSVLEEIIYAASFPSVKHELKVTESHLKTSQSLTEMLEKTSKERNLARGQASELEDERYPVSFPGVREQLKVTQTHLKACQSLIETLEQASQDKNLDEVATYSETFSNIKQELKATENYLKSCQSLITVLEKERRDKESFKQRPISASKSLDECMSKVLQSKLEIAERNIKSLENVVEGMQAALRNLEEENVKLESDLNMAKYSAKLCESSGNQRALLQVRLRDAEDELSSVHSKKTKLENEVQKLREENKMLTGKLSSNTQVKTYKASHETLSSLQSKLDEAEKCIQMLESSASKDKVENSSLKEENANLQYRLKIHESEKGLAKAYDDDVLALRNEVYMKNDEIQSLKESLHEYERKALEMNHYRKTLREEIEKLCDSMEKSESSKNLLSRKAIYKAAILRSAQALLQLDDDYNFQSVDAGQDSAFDEMKHQVSVYLTEVARIHELLTLKEQEREELLRGYLDLNEFGVPNTTSSLEAMYQEDSPPSGLESLPVSGVLSSAVNTSTESSAHSAQKHVQNKSTVEPHQRKRDSRSERNLNSEEEALIAVNDYHFSRYAQLEKLLLDERIQLAKAQMDIDTYQQTVEELKNQLNGRNDTETCLATLLDTMRSKEYNAELTMEQLKSEIKWLVGENQERCKKILEAHLELSQVKAENMKMQNELEDLKRQCINEKYEHAKISKELEHLHGRIGRS